MYSRSSKSNWFSRSSGDNVVVVTFVLSIVFSPSSEPTFSGNVAIMFAVYASSIIVPFTNDILYSHATLHNNKLEHTIWITAYLRATLLIDRCLMRVRVATLCLTVTKHFPKHILPLLSSCYQIFTAIPMSRDLISILLEKDRRITLRKPKNS